MAYNKSHNPRVIEQDMFFVGFNPEEAVENSQMYEWSEDAEEYAALKNDDDPRPPLLKVWRMRVTIDVSGAKEEAR